MTLENFTTLMATAGTINDAIRECPHLFDALAPAVSTIVNIAIDEKYNMLETHPELKPDIDLVFNNHVQSQYHYGL